MQDACQIQLANAFCRHFGMAEVGGALESLALWKAISKSLATSHRPVDKNSRISEVYEYN